MKSRWLQEEITTKRGYLLQEIAKLDNQIEEKNKEIEETKGNLIIKQQELKELDEDIETLRKE